MNEIIGAVADRFNYVIIIVLAMAALYIVFSSGNLVKRVMGLALFQTTASLFYITIGKVAGGRPPVVNDWPAPLSGPTPASPAPAGIGGPIPPPPGMGPDGALLGAIANPLPHVLILTAIVVGVAILAVGLALSVRIREVYGVIEEDALDRADAEAEAEALRQRVGTEGAPA